MGVSFDGNKGIQLGFTLIELLVVITIAAVFAALVPGYYERFRDAVQFKSLISEVISDLKQVRMVSNKINGGASYFWLDVSEGTFGTSISEKKSLPPNIKVEVTSGLVGEVRTKKHEFHFFPEGGSTGGTIVFIRESGAAARIEIDWLTGAISEKGDGYAHSQ